MIYFVVLCVCLFFLIFAKKLNIKTSNSTINTDTGEILTIFLFSLLTALRGPSVGTDTINYVMSANDILSQHFSVQSIMKGYYVERGYGLLEYFTMHFFGDVHVLFLLESLILLIGLFVFINCFESKVSIPFAFLVFFSLFYYSSLNISRQFISVGIGLFATKYLFNKKTIPYLICCLFAIVFHKSGLGFVLNYFVWQYLSNTRSNVSYKRKTVLLLIVTIIVCVFLYPIASILQSIGIFPEKYMELLNSSGETASVLYMIIQSIPILALVALLWRKLIEYDERNKLVIVLCIMGVIVSMLGTVFSNVGRVALPLTVWKIILYPQCCKLLVRQQKHVVGEIVIKSVFVIFFIGYWYYCAIYRGFGGTVPYTSDVYNVLNLSM